MKAKQRIHVTVRCIYFHKSRKKLSEKRKICQVFLFEKPKKYKIVVAKSTVFLLQLKCVLFYLKVISQFYTVLRNPEEKDKVKEEIYKLLPIFENELTEKYFAGISYIKGPFTLCDFQV